jgi:hypothetical protein
MYRFSGILDGPRQRLPYQSEPELDAGETRDSDARAEPHRSSQHPAQIAPLHMGNTTQRTNTNTAHPPSPGAAPTPPCTMCTVIWSFWFVLVFVSLGLVLWRTFGRDGDEVKGESAGLYAIAVGGILVLQAQIRHQQTCKRGEETGWSLR